MSFSLTSRSTTTILPSPNFSDQEASTVEVSLKLAADGTTYTYVKTKGGRRRFQWPFRLPREKALELQAFIFSFSAESITIVDHKNQTIIGRLTSNPFEFDVSSKGLISRTQGVRNETVDVTLTFEGFVQ